MHLRQVSVLRAETGRLPGAARRVRQRPGPISRRPPAHPPSPCRHRSRRGRRRSTADGNGGYESGAIRIHPPELYEGPRVLRQAGEQAHRR